VNLAPQRWRGAGVRISTTATGRDAQPHRSRSLTYREPHARTASAKFGIHGRNGTERAASICGEMRGMTVSSPSAQPFCSSSSAPSGSTPPPINDKVRRRQFRYCHCRRLRAVSGIGCPGSPTYRTFFMQPLEY
jgi:hypothetical protein